MHTTTFDVVDLSKSLQQPMHDAEPVVASPVRFQLRFTGRVQGVGFRATTRAIARRHPVTGWVRNEPDGSVLAQFQGEPAPVAAALEKLTSEMGHNIVRTDRDEIPLEAGETAFEIAY